MGIRTKKSQSILEYVVLLCIVVSSLLIMQFYVKRTYQGRLKQEADEVGQQYSPGHTTAHIQTLTETESTTYTGGTCEGQKVPDGMTVTKSNTGNYFIKQEGVDSFAADE